MIEWIEFLKVATVVMPIITLAFICIPTTSMSLFFSFLGSKAYWYIGNVLILITVAAYGCQAAINVSLRVPSLLACVMFFILGIKYIFSARKDGKKISKISFGEKR